MSNVNLLIPDIGRKCETTGFQKPFGRSFPPFKNAIFKGWGIDTVFNQLTTCGILEFEDGTIALLHVKEFKFKKD